MPSYKLLYFNARGRAENARTLFAVAGVAYEDKRIEQGEWGSLKSKLNFGVMPSLQVDGVSISMSQAIANYLAREFGLYGKSNLESTRIDVTYNALVDMVTLLYDYIFAKDDAKKKECMKKFSDKAESYGPGLEKFLMENGGGDYFVKSGLSLADIAFFNAYSEMKIHKPDVLDKTPKLKALYDRVAANEKIAKWVKTRPETPF
ncbi:S-crystallin SL11-like [Anneissia japonica]|uniref:S-crystallin SL11-like n=1 Tax=Anneissia japonica TaxID=1529436 RepID=UPI0014254DA5|nr:S-crystallin SL11-like [Anneissia japonica]